MWAASILLMLLSISTAASQEKRLFVNANCTIIYSLKQSSDKYFVDEISQLQVQLKKQNIALIDLNNWRIAPPHIEVTGRQKNQIRSSFKIPSNTNQAVIFNRKGQIISRHTGPVTLVNALLDCQN